VIFFSDGRRGRTILTIFFFGGGPFTEKKSHAKPVPLEALFLVLVRRLIHSKGARTAAASTPIGPRARL
jgi:hypothetical protein